MSDSDRRSNWVSTDSARILTLLTSFVVIAMVVVAVAGATGAVRADGSTAVATPDTADAAGSVSAECTPGGSGTLTVDVYDHDGGRVEEGEVYLFDPSSYELQYDTEFFGGEFSFQTIDLGEYNVEVYTDDGEFLGTSYICHRGYTSTNYQAGSPNLDSVSYEERSGDGDGVVEPGERVLISPRVVNDDDYPLDVRTEITYEGESKTRGPLSVSGSGSKASYGAQFAVNDGGEKDVTIEVYAKYGGGWTLTHEVDRTLEVDEVPTSDREDPDDDSVDVVVGESVTFEVDAEDDDRLGGVEWYVDGDYKTRDGLRGDDDTDEFTVTFESAGTYTVEADVYDDSNEGSTYNDDAAEWTVDVDEPVTYTLSTASSDGGSVSVSPDNNEYRDGETVTLTAEASDSFEFDRWAGDVPSYKRDDSEIRLEMDRDRSVQAVFTRSEGAVQLDVQHPDGDRVTEVNAILVRQDGDLVRQVTWPGGDPVDVPRQFDGLTAGKEYSFEVYVNDQFAVAKRVTVTADETRRVTAETEGQLWIRPKVVDAAGNPLEGVSVTVYSHEYDQNDGDRVEPWRGNPTDERGYVETPAGDGRLYLHPDDDSGYYVIVVSRDSEQIARKTVDGLTSNQRVTVETSVTSVDPAVEGWTVREATSDDGQIAVGERTAVGVTLRNDGTEMPLRTVFQFDTDGDGEPEAVDVNGDGQPDRVDYDGDGESEPGTVRGDVTTTPAAGATQPFGLRFSPNEAGDWRVRAVMQGQPNDDWVDAGTTDWEGFSVVGTEESAAIVHSETTLPSGTFGPGDDVTATVTVENTGTVEETFYVGYTATHRESEAAYDVAAEEVTLPPGTTRQVTLTWTVPEVPQTGEFDLVTAAWRDSTDDGLVGRQDDAAGTVTVEADGVVTVVEYRYGGSGVESDERRVDVSGTPVPFADAELPEDTDEYTQPSFVDSKRTERRANTDEYPWSAVGLVESNSWSCSGVVIEDNHVLTAAHCLYDDSGDHGDITFVPGKNGVGSSSEPFGSVDVTQTQTLSEYANTPATYQTDYDVAVLTLAENVADETGTFGIDSGANVADLSRVSGYPETSDLPYTYRSQVEFSVIGTSEKVFVRDSSQTCSVGTCVVYNTGVLFDEETRSGVSGGPVWVHRNGRPAVQMVNSGSRSDGISLTDNFSLGVPITEELEQTLGVMVARGNERNVHPEATFEVSVSSPSVGTEVTLDATASSDPDGETLSYEWDLDGDGQFDRNSGDTPTIEWTPQSPGEREVTVKIVDSDGDSDTASRKLQVQREQESVPSFQDDAVYVWGYADDLARDAAARERFIDRADEQDLNTVFLSWGALSTASTEQRATLLRTLDESGIQTHAMIGAAGPNAVQTTRDTIPQILAYNANRPAAEQFDGLHLDAEPGETDVKSFLDDYQTLLSEIETGISGGGETVRSQELAVSSAVGWWWDQSDQAPDATDEFVDSPALDYVVVMAYYDEAREVRERTRKITDETDTPYVVAVETQEFPADGTTERVSFYEEGSQAATDALAAIADDPPREGYRGGALHYYQSAVATWDSLSGGTTPDSVARGETATVETDIVFDDSFPQSSHRSQLVVEFRGPDGTETVRKTVTPPGGEVTTANVDWTPPADVATGEYTVVATLRDTTFENGDHAAIGSRGDPVRLDTVQLGTVTVTEETESPTEPLSAIRQLPDSVQPGDRITVSIRTSVDGEVSGLGVDEEGPLPVVSQSATPQATYRSDKRQWLFVSTTDRTAVVNYTVQVPADAEPGTQYTFDGTVSAADTESTAVGGDTTVVVRRCAVGAVAGDDNRIDLRELQRAIGDWADSEPVAGEPVDLRTVQRLIGLWADSEPATCGG